ncbi:hypothetical protein GCM10023213_24860 [Prosthecobacter algae]|uniref:Uncharacterized protein n=1 Tax=Prosthecobacter algae TaxID=1144682 RepID=A0ABP9P8S5_9BACT
MLVDAADFLFQNFGYFFTIESALMRLAAQHWLDLPQSEARRETFPDELNLRDDRDGIDAVAAGRALGPGQQALPLIEADGLRADARLGGESADQD